MAGETPDTDPVETREWLDSVDAVVESDGRERMGYLLDQAIDHAQDFGVKVSAGLSTPYVNTIPVEEEPAVPGDPELERLATALVRWNAIAIVLQANAESSELGGHIASYQSAETLYEVGFNHFWRARTEEHARDVVDPGDRKVWAVMGDGEMDEPESMGAISLAGREKLDNLVFVINCNLQRLDGPVRGNGKIIQELETNFRGAGWNVIKVIWGSGWDDLLAADTTGMLR